MRDREPWSSILGVVSGETLVDFAKAVLLRNEHAAVRGEGRVDRFGRPETTT
jgi:hypothetical protein